MKKLYQISITDLSKLEKNETNELLEDNKTFFKSIFLTRSMLAIILFLGTFAVLQVLFYLVEGDNYLLSLKNEVLFYVSKGDYSFLFLFLTLFLFFIILFSYFIYKIIVWNKNRKSNDFNEKYFFLEKHLVELEQKERDENNRIMNESKSLIEKLKKELKEKNISESDFWLEFRKVYFN